MAVEVGRDGSFSFAIEPEQLSKGLRPSRRLPRNSGYLTTCDGAVGKHGVLKAMDELTPLVTALITDGFPYPQIFVFVNILIVCGNTEIYEWDSGLVLKYTATAPGSMWDAVDFNDFIYLSNGSESVVRDPLTKVYTLSDQPVARAMCRYNDQVLICPGVA